MRYLNRNLKAPAFDTHLLVVENSHNNHDKPQQPQQSVMFNRKW